MFRHGYLESENCVLNYTDLRKTCETTKASFPQMTKDLIFMMEHLHQDLHGLDVYDTNQVKRQTNEYAATVVKPAEHQCNNQRVSATRS